MQTSRRPKASRSQRAARSSSEKSAAERLYHDPEFILIQLDDVGELERIAENFRRVKILAQIYVEDARRAAADFLKEQANRGARLRRTLRERAEADGVGGGSELLPLRSPFEEIPRDIFDNIESGLAGWVDIDLGDTGGMSRVDLKKFAAETDALKAASSVAAERVAADTARHDAVIAQEAGHVGKVGGRAAEFFALRQNVPKEFAEADNVVGLMRHGLCSLGMRGMPVHDEFFVLVDRR